MKQKLSREVEFDLIGIDRMFAENLVRMFRSGDMRGVDIALSQIQDEVERGKNREQSKHIHLNSSLIKY